MNAIGGLTVTIALGGALSFAISLHVQKIGLKYADPRFGSAINIATTTILCWMAAPFLLETEYFFTTAMFIFAGIGILRPAVSVTLATEGIKYLGPSMTSGLAATTPIFSAFLGIVVLGEILSWPIALGTAAVVGGVIVSTWRSDGSQTNWPIWAIALPLGAALIRSSSHLFIKLGFSEVPSPYFALLIIYTVSLIVVTASYPVQRRPFPKFKLGHLWFVLAGVVTTCAMALINTALLMGDLVKVQPLIASTPIFTILINYLIFRHETISWRTWVTVALISAGVFMVGILD